MKHYTEKLSAYLHQELPKEQQQMIAEHLLQCADCRAEHDEIKFGATLATKLERVDAPPMIWSKIENTLDNRQKQNTVSFFNWQVLATTAAVILLIFGGYFAFLRKTETDKAENKINPPQSNEWSVEIISGQSIKENEKLEVGEILETDANSRAKVQVANIGQVEISPNSRLQLVKTESTEHRLSLKEGEMKAFIFAPPRLFIVDTPSAVAVDLGCAYTLEVDKEGNSKLHVTSGYVALERDGRESIVPAGGMAITKKGKGLGTPYYEDVSAQFQKAVYQFDFESGGTKALKTILANSREKDALTLWHLLFRTNGADREQVFKTLNKLVKLPKNTTKEGMLKLDKDMLKLWQEEIGIRWY
jgi:hypothetical protein